MSDDLLLQVILQIGQETFSLQQTSTKQVVL